MFIAALLTIAKKGKQPECPSKTFDKEDTVWICNVMLFNQEKEQNFAICSSIDGLGGHYAKLDKSEKTNTLWSHLYVKSKIYNKLVNITEKKQTSDIKKKVGVTSGRKVAL